MHYFPRFTAKTNKQHHRGSSLPGKMPFLCFCSTNGGSPREGSSGEVAGNLGKEFNWTFLLLSENAKWYLCRSVHHEPFSGQVLGKQQAKKNKIKSHTYNWQSGNGSCFQGDLGTGEGSGFQGTRRSPLLVNHNSCSSSADIHSP